MVEFERSGIPFLRLSDFDGGRLAHRVRVLAPRVVPREFASRFVSEGVVEGDCAFVSRAHLETNLARTELRGQILRERHEAPTDPAPAEGRVAGDAQHAEHDALLVAR